MQEPAVVIIAALAALFVGMCVPLVARLYATARSLSVLSEKARTLLDRVGPNLEAGTAALSAAAARVEAASRELQPSMTDARRVLAETEQLAAWANQAARKLELATIVGTAAGQMVGGALSSLRHESLEQDRRNGNET